jgi:hypothetical protein
MKKIKIKWTFDVAGMVIMSAAVFFTAGCMFADIANYGLYDVIKHCAIIFIGGTLLVIHTKVLIQDIFKLLPKDERGVK